MPAETARWIRVVILVAGYLAARGLWAVQTQYIYDGEGRLREIARDDGWQIVLDYDEAGNLITRDLEATMSADLSVILSDIPDPVEDGTLLTYVSTITNAGPNSAAGVRYSMTVPGALPVQTLTTSQGSCTTNSEVSCNLGTLAAGATATVSAQVVATGASSLNVAARATSAIFDPDSGNNTDVEATVVTYTGGGPIYLSLGQLDSGQYGHRYGSNEHQDELVLVFEGVAEDLLFSVVGHDVDAPVELSLSLNDEPLGFLGVSPNEGDNLGDTFLIPASATFDGPNQLRIAQRVPGSKWGVTNLLLSRANDISGPTLSLAVGALEWGAYGWNFGSGLHLIELVATFEGTAESLYLFVLGYDLEFADEITVWVNDKPLGSLRRGRDSSLSRWSRFEIRAQDQLPGTNRIRFQKGYGDSTWGIALPILWQPRR